LHHYKELHISFLLNAQRTTTLAANNQLLWVEADQRQQYRRGWRERQRQHQSRRPVPLLPPERLASVQQVRRVLG
jgi:hypothetical protein